MPYDHTTLDVAFLSHWREVGRSNQGDLTIDHEALRVQTGADAGLIERPRVEIDVRPRQPRPMMFSKLPLKSFDGFGSWQQRLIPGTANVDAEPSLQPSVPFHSLR